MLSSSSHPSTAPAAQDSGQAYRDAGVDFQRADQVVASAKTQAKRTMLPFVLSSIGGFSGAFEIPPGYQQPVMLAACDGVGTKLEIAKRLNIHHTIGIDLVAMNVNDLLTQGGRPLVFLDYLAAGQLDPLAIDAVLTGIAEGCLQADCALIGGETAEMPGFYPPGDYELAGFTVGVVEKSRMLPRPHTMEEGDVLIGLSSSGFHSNGYSLIRKLCFGEHPVDLNQALSNGQTWGEALLAPTRIYVKPILALLKALETSNHLEALKGMVHITGGGFQDNIPRILPPHLAAMVQWGSWTLPPVMEAIQKKGQLDIPTMARTFNCGIGFALVVSQSQVSEVMGFLQEFAQHDYDVHTIGQLISAPEGQHSQVIIKESTP